MWYILQGNKEREKKSGSQDFKPVLSHRLFVIARQGEILTIDEKGAYMSSCSGLVNCRLIIKM